MKSDPTKNGLQTAAGDAKSATETLASDLKGLGKPDTPSGQQAKDSLDQLSTSLQKDVTTIENTVKGVSGLRGALSRRPDGDGHIRDDGDGGQDDVHQPPGARREGRAEERVRRLERLQLPDEQRFLMHGEPATGNDGLIVKTTDEREQILERSLEVCSAQGWRIEARSESRRRSPNLRDSYGLMRF